MKNQIILLVIVILFQNRILAEDWIWQNPQPQGNDLNGVVFVSESMGWAVGDAGTIMKTTNGGDSWSVKYLGIKESLNYCYFANEDIGWVATDWDLYKTTNGGEYWFKQSFGSITVSRITQIYFQNSQTGFICTGTLNFLKTTDGGQSWQKINSSGKDKIEKISFINKSGAFGLSRNNEYEIIVKTTNQGYSWIAVSDTFKHPCEIYNLFFTDDSNGWICGKKGNKAAIYNTSDGGHTWDTLKFSSDYTIKQIYFSDSSNGAIVSTDIFRLTSDGGKNWYYPKFINQHDRFIYDVFLLNASNGWAVGPYGEIIRNTGINNVWESCTRKLFTDNYFDLRSVFFYDEKFGFLLTEYDWFFRSTDGGLSWNKIQTEFKKILNHLHFINKDRIWACGEGGTLLKSVDGGLKWVKVDLNTSENLTEVYFLDESEGWIVGDGIPFLKTSDGGENWFYPNGSGLFWLKSISFVDKNNGWAVGNPVVPQILNTTDGGLNWTNRTDSFKYQSSQIKFIDKDHGWINSSRGIYRTTDGGNKWELSLEANGIVDMFLFDRNNGWAIDDVGYNLYTTDFGSTWYQYPRMITRGIVSASFPNPDCGWVVGEPRQILKYSGKHSDISDYATIPQSISISPNPASDYIEINLEGWSPSSRWTPSDLKIFNTLGECVMAVEALHETSLQRLDISGLPDGVYLVVIEDQNGKLFVKY